MWEFVRSRADREDIAGLTFIDILTYTYTRNVRTHTPTTDVGRTFWKSAGFYPHSSQLVLFVHACAFSRIIITLIVFVSL